ncbi:hypothetical protein DBT_1750 [Dissulfuribacter thermophilus]|uniref:Uncharacterized protein n=1 Tax=Dissulfuribacter thermophilus TaxID=1156395 RepID=A0A1B9F560_9BACT|nr:hypothetical protein DBT_1750 [Dissulfuribacter thermophilus]
MDPFEGIETYRESPFFVTITISLNEWTRLRGLRFMNAAE